MIAYEWLYHYNNMGKISVGVEFGERVAFQQRKCRQCSLRIKGICLITFLCHSVVRSELLGIGGQRRLVAIHKERSKVVFWNDDECCAILNKEPNRDRRRSTLGFGSRFESLNTEKCTLKAKFNSKHCIYKENENALDVIGKTLWSIFHKTCAIEQIL